MQKLFAFVATFAMAMMANGAAMAADSAGENRKRPPSRSPPVSPLASLPLAPPWAKVAWAPRRWKALGVIPMPLKSYSCRWC